MQILLCLVLYIKNYNKCPLCMFRVVSNAATGCAFRLVTSSQLAKNSRVELFLFKWELVGITAVHSVLDA